MPERLRLLDDADPMLASSELVRNAVNCDCEGGCEGGGGGDCGDGGCGEGCGEGCEGCGGGGDGDGFKQRI